MESTFVGPWQWRAVVLGGCIFSCPWNSLAPSFGIVFGSVAMILPSFVWLGLGRVFVGFFSVSFAPWDVVVLCLLGVSVVPVSFAFVIVLFRPAVQGRARRATRERRFSFW